MYTRDSYSFFAPFNAAANLVLLKSSPDRTGISFANSDSGNTVAPARKCVRGGTVSLDSPEALTFMTAFPDMVVSSDDVTLCGDDALFKWTLVGTNTGTGGTGKPVRISGYEESRFGENGLIGKSKGHFDEVTISAN